jgi:hypothetical protein
MWEPGRYHGAGRRAQLHIVSHRWRDCVCVCGCACVRAVRACGACGAVRVGGWWFAGVGGCGVGRLRSSAHVHTSACVRPYPCAFLQHQKMEEVECLHARLTIFVNAKQHMAPLTTACNSTQHPDPTSPQKHPVHARHPVSNCSCHVPAPAPVRQRLAMRVRLCDKGFAALQRCSLSINTALPSSTCAHQRPLDN